MLSPDQFRKVEEVFDAVADAPPGERAALLDRLCTVDTALRTEVESLLGSLEGAPEQIAAVIGDAARSAAQATPGEGSRIGPYRLARELGRGGMGTVYLAVRDDEEYSTEVAIKVLQSGGLETAEAVARFRDERQILAGLEHPGIVRLLDGGSTGDGLPYLVMEAVAGSSITDWADAHGLDVRARVQLFRKVCSAVAYAHQKLVVHRDIKPANILVTAAGEPKLLDFGIARLLDPARRAEARRAPTRLLTPEYASPEQLRGEPVSTGTDVYALGAVLYELLSGSRAHRLQGEGLQALQALLETDPPFPSMVAPPARRGAIAGDLDNIVLKALQKDMSQRYASVEQLSADLGRSLEGLPVLARPGTWTYRLRKLLWRNRAIAAGVAIVLASLSAATFVSLREARRADEQARRAQERFAQVRQLANAMLFEVDHQIENLEGATQARELIVSRALGYLDGLARESGDDPALLRELALAYTKTGDIQGSPLVPSLGRPRDALASYAKAREILERLVRAGHGDVQTRWALVRALDGVASANRLVNDLALSRANALAAVDLIGTLPEDDSFDYAVVARGYSQLLDLETENADFRAAQVHADELLRHVTRWQHVHPSAEAQYWEGISLEVRGSIASRVGDPGPAVAHLRRAVEVLQALAEAHPDEVPYHRELAFAHVLTAASLSGFGDTWLWLPRGSDLPAAELEQRKALELAEKLAHRDPGDRRAAFELSVNEDALAMIVGERDPEAAFPQFQQARDTFTALPEAFRTAGYAMEFEWFGKCAMGVALARAGRRTAALDVLEQGLAVAHRNAEIEGASFEDRLGPWECRFQKARALRALGDPAGAARELDAVITGLAPILAQHPATILPYQGALEALEQLGELRPESRCGSLRQALDLWRSWPGAWTSYLQSQRAELERQTSECGVPATPAPAYASP
jgi:tetratricopeptide (TPR) repeat protein